MCASPPSQYTMRMLAVHPFPFSLLFVPLTVGGGMDVIMKYLPEQPQYSIIISVCDELAHEYALTLEIVNGFDAAKELIYDII